MTFGCKVKRITTGWKFDKEARLLLENLTKAENEIAGKKKPKHLDTLLATRIIEMNKNSEGRPVRV